MGGGIAGRGMAPQPCPIAPLLPLALPSSAPWFFSCRKRVPATLLHFWGEDGRSMRRSRGLAGRQGSQLCQALSSDAFIKSCWQGIFVWYLTFFMVLFLTPLAMPFSAWSSDCLQTRGVNLKSHSAQVSPSPTPWSSHPWYCSLGTPLPACFSFFSYFLVTGPLQTLQNIRISFISHHFHRGLVHF